MELVQTCEGPGIKQEFLKSNEEKSRVNRRKKISKKKEKKRKHIKSFRKSKGIRSHLIGTERPWEDNRGSFQEAE